MSAWGYAKIRYEISEFGTKGMHRRMADPNRIQMDLAV